MKKKFLYIILIMLFSTTTVFAYSKTQTGSLDGTSFVVTSYISSDQSYSEATTEFYKSALTYANNYSLYGSNQDILIREQSYDGGSVTASKSVGIGFDIYYCKATGGAKLPDGSGEITRTAIVDLR